MSTNLRGPIVASGTAGRETSLWRDTGPDTVSSPLTPSPLRERGDEGADIATALAEFEQTLEITRSGRREHVGASGDLRAVASEITEQVRLLDGLVRYRFGDDAELMAAWASARNVVGPFRSRGEAERGGAETPGVVKPAA